MLKRHNESSTQLQSWMESNTCNFQDFLGMDHVVAKTRGNEHLYGWFVDIDYNNHSTTPFKKESNEKKRKRIITDVTFSQLPPSSPSFSCSSEEEGSESTIESMIDDVIFPQLPCSTNSSYHNEKEGSKRSIDCIDDLSLKLLISPIRNHELVRDLSWSLTADIVDDILSDVVSCSSSSSSSPSNQFKRPRFLTD